ncbi:MAG: hypothetical protein J6B64_01835 [Bacilli bacterium]|nr:hypothetical protein [Bacilli bacterium]MBP3921296.1 hypothetical protein [Bacilli bacterium]
MIKNKKEKMQELYNLKKAYSQTSKKSYGKLSDTLIITNDRINTIVLTVGVIVCSIFISIITG